MLYFRLEDPQCTFRNGGKSVASMAALHAKFAEIRAGLEVPFWESLIQRGNRNVIVPIVVAGFSASEQDPLLTHGPQGRLDYFVFRHNRSQKSYL